MEKEAKSPIRMIIKYLLKFTSAFFVQTIEIIKPLVLFKISFKLNPTLYRSHFVKEQTEKMDEICDIVARFPYLLM